MVKKKDFLAIITIVLAIVTSVAGLLSVNFTKAYDFVNQYGHTVEMYGYGNYQSDVFYYALSSEKRECDRDFITGNYIKTLHNSRNYDVSANDMPNSIGV